MKKLPTLTEIEARIDAVVYHAKESTKSWRPVEARKSQEAAQFARRKLSEALTQVFAALGGDDE